MKTKIILFALLLVVPFLGISSQVDNSSLKTTETYARPKASSIGQFSFVGQNVPENSKGQTFLTKYIPKAINTSGRIIMHDISGTSRGFLKDVSFRFIHQPATNSHSFIDRFLRSSISPQAP